MEFIFNGKSSHLVSHMLNWCFRSICWGTVTIALQPSNHKSMAQKNANATTHVGAHPCSFDVLKPFLGMNIIDLLAILPFYIELIQPTNVPLAFDESETNALFIQPSTTTVSSPITTPPSEVEDVERVGGMDDVLQVFRIFKLARILKLARCCQNKYLLEHDSPVVADTRLGCSQLPSP